MKPTRLRLSVTRLPTITEAHEDASQTGCSSHSLEEYVDSIKVLAQPTVGPVRVARTSRPRLFSKPLDKFPGTCSSSHNSSRAQRSCSISLRMDELSQSISSHRDPLDWLFGQTQFPLIQDDHSGSASSPAALRLL